MTTLEEARSYVTRRGVGLDIARHADLRVGTGDLAGRVVLPWRGEDGRESYLTGRALNGRTPKYLHSKGQRPALYASPGAWEAERVALVEGHLDALVCASAGVSAFATAGSSLSDAAVDILGTKQEVVLVPDADDTGARWLEQAVEKLSGRVPRLLRATVPESCKDAADVAEAAVARGDDPAEAVAELLLATKAVEVAPKDVSTWSPVDLTDALAGKGVEPPTMWTRSDGRCFIYSARVHWFQGESESCKSWAAQSIAADELNGDRPVLYIDYEDDELGVVSRLRSLGVSAVAIRNFLVYIRPDEALSGDAEADFDAVLADRTFSLVIIDGVTESMTIEGLEIVSNTDVAHWIRMLPKRIARLDGAAVVCIDHVTKASESQGRYAIGGQHKLAGTTGAAYRFTTVQALTRPTNLEPVLGIFDVTVVKDRPGYVRGHTLGDKIGAFKIEASPDDKVSADLVSPGESGPDHKIVSEILAYLSDYDGSSKTAIEVGVEGRAERVREALRWMAADERAWIRIEQKGRSHLHTLTQNGRDELDRRTK